MSNSVYYPFQNFPTLGFSLLNGSLIYGTVLSSHADRGVLVVKRSILIGELHIFLLSKPYKFRHIRRQAFQHTAAAMSQFQLLFVGVTKYSYTVVTL